MIDIFTHVLPPKYLAAIGKLATAGKVSAERSDALQSSNPLLIDIEQRLKVMTEFPDVMNVLTLVTPPIELLAGPTDSPDLARIANDNMAEIVQRYPDKFVAIAALPYNNMPAALREADRAVRELKLKGVQIFSTTINKPLDAPDFLPLYEKMAQYELPIWIHPVREPTEADYPGEAVSKYNLAGLLGWPHATGMAMARLAYSGVLEKYPGIKFVTHHDGGTIPYIAARISHAPFGPQNLSRPVVEYLKMFYYDTAVQGNTANLMCSFAFAGADQMLFGSDFPMASADMVKETIFSINAMTIPEVEKRKIFEGNARQLLKLKK